MGKHVPATKKSDRYKDLFLKLVALCFIISGLNGIIRTYCVSLPSTGHLIHACVILTAPLAFMASGAILFIGIILLFMDSVLKWLVGR